MTNIDNCFQQIFPELPKDLSDIHISENDISTFRINGDIKPLACSPSTIRRFIQHVKTEAIDYNETSRKTFNEKGNVDFGLDIQMPDETVQRFRVNVYKAFNGLNIAMRIIKTDIPTLKDLMVPSVFYKLTQREHGLIIVSGPTGSGKTTTLAAMINEMNTPEHPRHIITIEDPIEYIHKSKGSVIHQREVGIHTPTFHEGLKAALREDPDVILVGEMRDMETIMTALNAAETGHLVLTTLHTSSVIESIDRLIQYFPTTQYDQIRNQVANCFEAIITQKLFPYKNGNGRIAAFEIALRTTATVNLIRQNKAYQINDTLKNSPGMQLMEDAVKDLNVKNII